MNCWILQCNINHYRWIDQMKEHKNDPDTWAISRYVNEVNQEDIAFIWLSNEKGKNNRGIYAMGEITKLLDKNMKSFSYEEPFWRKTKAAREAKERRMLLPSLELQYTFPYTDTLINKPILKDKLEEVGLGDLLVIKRPRGTSICEVTRGCETIKKMVESR